MHTSDYAAQSYIVGSPLLTSTEVSGSDDGNTAGASAGSGAGEAWRLGFFAATFFGAALAAFFTTVLDLDLVLVLLFVFVLAFAFDFAFAFVFGAAFSARLAFLAAPFLATVFFAFTFGRFFDLLFFAMINHLLEIIRTRSESSPEKVPCHLCMMLESVSRIQ